jgi:hypothetical protein
MTDDMMNLRMLVEKAPDADLLREMIGLAAQRLMELEVEGQTGAPFAYKTTNISVRVLFAGNDRLQDVFVANDPDGLVVDLDCIDD